MARFWVNVGAIDAQAGDHFADGKGQAIEGEIAVSSIAAGDALEQKAQLVDLARKRNQHDHFLGRIGEVLEALGSLLQEPKVNGAEKGLVLPGDKESIEHVEIVVPRGALDSPIRA